MMGDVHSRIRQLEKQLVELESYSPEYVQTMVRVHNVCKMSPFIIMFSCRFLVGNRAEGKPLDRTHTTPLLLQ